jgi:transglutaminase-like putative cysteine protease
MEAEPHANGQPASVRYQIVHATNYFYSEAVPLCQNEVHLKPRDTRRQQCLAHRLAIHPLPRHVEECRDYFGNLIHFFTIADRHSELSVAAHSEIELAAGEALALEESGPWERVRAALLGLATTDLDVRQFVFDSPHVAISPRLAAYAATSFAPGRPWLEASLDLMGRIHREFAYDPTATNVSTPLETVLALKRGVCQDFAHLQIGCLRSLGLPARYVSGYLRTTPPPGQTRLIGADASHAWISAWCEEFGWVDFDPTNNVVPALGHLTVAWGRDYSDVCPIKGVFIGGGHHSVSVSVDVEPLEAP